MRRNVPSHGTAHATPLFDVQVYGTLVPGGNCQALPFFRNKYPETEDEPPYLAFGNLASGAITLYDPHYRVCAGGTNGGGEILQATYDYYANRYVTVGEFGLSRFATLAAELPVSGGPVAATINISDPDGNGWASVAIQVYYVGTQGDNIPIGTVVPVRYISSNRKWLTAFYYDAS